MIATLTLGAIDAALERDQERDHRRHLGASVVSDKCARKIYYGFRWAKKELFGGQMLRLFDRGQQEEIRFAAWLRVAGATVLTKDEETGRQYTITDCGGHFGGSLDSLVWNLPDVPLDWGWGLGEYKTHNDKSWNSLAKDGLANSKPEHFGQMQAYQFKFGLKWGIYLAVNKNNDHLHAEIVPTQPAFAQTLITKARNIIFGESAPARINQSPGFYICKWCRYHGICHMGEPVERNCRTCDFSRPVDGGKWECTKYKVELSTADQARGVACPGYSLKETFK